MKAFPLRALKAWNDGAYRPYVCALGGSAPAGNTTTTQTSNPWSGEQPQLLNIYNQADNLYNQGGPQYYPGQTYAPLQAPQTALINEAEALGGAGGTSGLQTANNSLTSMLSPDYTAMTQQTANEAQTPLSNILNMSTNPYSDPGFQTTVNDTIASVLPGITSSFTNGNRSDSGLATEAATQGVTNAVGQLALGQYNQNLNQQQTAAQTAMSDLLTQQGNQSKDLLAAPSIDQATLSDINGGLQAGATTQQDLQNQINAAMAQYNYGQILPYNTLGLYENAITGTGNPGGTSTTSQPYFSNPTANLISTGTGLGTLGLLGAALL